MSANDGIDEFLNAGGTLSTTPTAFFSGFTPLGMAFDSSGNLFASNFGAGSIVEFASGGGQNTFPTGLHRTAGLAFNSHGILFESDSSTGNINEFTSLGTESLFASGLSDPSAMAFDSSDDLFVVDPSLQAIFKYTPDGTQTVFATGFYTSLAFNSAGVLFAGDPNNAGIDEFTPDGTETIFTSDIDSGTYPNAMAFQPEPVPEPSTWALLIIGVAVMIGFGRRKTVS
jgi:sugar lactone lactonase YvrE